MPCAKPNNGERGAALIILMALILMGGLSMAMEALLIKSKRTRSDQKASYAMVEAKRALLAYAVMDAGTPAQFGNLPCPFMGNLSDYMDNANTTSPCGDTDTFMAIGFFPWKSMQLPPLIDGDNAPLWYAVAGNFKIGSGQTMPFTCNPTDNLTINGAGNYAAIIFSPGEPLPLLAPATDQNRPDTDTATTLRDQFLEKSNATAAIDAPPPIDFEIARIMTSEAGGATNPPFNDRLLGVTCQEIINAVNQL